MVTTTAVVETELEALPQRPTSHAGQDTPAQSDPEEGLPVPVLKLVGSGFSFFCAGVNDGTLGALVPYILSTFAIGTGTVALIYACTFVGWFLAAVTNPILAARMSLGQLLFLGASLQLLAQCLRAPFPGPPSLGLYFTTFFVQALGMAYQDAHANTFVSRMPKSAHRWLGFVHACYALGLLVGPPIATAIAVASASDTAGSSSGLWRRVYFVLIGIEAINLAGVTVGFRDSLWGGGTVNTRSEPLGQDQEPPPERKKTRDALRGLVELMGVKSVWIISLFYFFYLGAAFTSAGWVVEFLTTVRKGKLSLVGYVPMGSYAGTLLGRIFLAEPTFRFGERRMLLVYTFIIACLQLVFWLAPNIAANAVALSLIGFFGGPFFATGVSVASKIFPRKIQAQALSFMFVVAQAGGAIFPSLTGLIAARAGVQVLQPIALSLFLAAGVCWYMVPKAPEQRNE